MNPNEQSKNSQKGQQKAFAHGVGGRWSKANDLKDLPLEASFGR
jgi:hypothetical protein